MKNKICNAIILFLIATRGYAQDSTGLSYAPYFSAIIVGNVDTATRWYQSLFDLKAKKLSNLPRGFRITILESSQFVLELIEDSSSLGQKEILQSKAPGAHIRGFFKIGFKVPDVDDCVKHLSRLRIHVDRIYTDAASKKRNFLITDPDGNLVQFFE